MHRAGALLAMMVLAAVVTSCGAPVEAKPTEVTYYYLPG